MSAPAADRGLLPVTLRVERRLGTPRWLPLAATLAAIGAALVLSGLLLALIGADPFAVFAHILGASFGDLYVLSDTLVKATPLILTGLACSLAFRMRLWNIGAEGQLLMGAWGASAVVLLGIFPAGTPGIILIPAMVVGGMVAGALWGGIAGVLRARLNVNEIITTLMLNYVALSFLRFWVFGPWSEGGFQQTVQFPRDAWLGRLTELSWLIPDVAGMTVHGGFLLALVAAGIVWWVLSRTRTGYEIRLAGDNPQAARYAGIDLKRKIVLVFLASGALAGLAGASEVSGTVHRLQDSLALGYGFTGIVIAYLAKFHPLGVIVAAIGFGALILAGREIQPAGIPAMIQGIVLVCVIVADALTRYTLRVVRR